MRFIVLCLFLTLAGGLFLRSGIEVTPLQWVGHLPGDLILRKEGAEIQLPLASAGLVSILFSFLGGLFRSK